MDSGSHCLVYDNMTNKTMKICRFLNNTILFKNFVQYIYYLEWKLHVTLIVAPLFSLIILLKPFKKVLDDYIKLR